MHVAWAIAYTALRNGEELAVGEEKSAMTFIEKRIGQGKELPAAFSEISQRMLLARHHYNRHYEVRTPLPSKFFYSGNHSGYSRTKESFKAIEFERVFTREYMCALKFFGIAVLEVSEYPQGPKFHAWRSCFLERDRSDMYNLFLSAVNEVVRREE